MTCRYCDSEMKRETPGRWYCRDCGHDEPVAADLLMREQAERGRTAALPGLEQA